MTLLDDEGKKRLADQVKTNDERFSEYDTDLQLSFQSTPRQLAYHRWMIPGSGDFWVSFRPRRRWPSSTWPENVFASSSRALSTATTA